MPLKLTRREILKTGAASLAALPAPGLLGLQHYKFGRTTTLVRPEANWSPTSPFDAVAENHARGQIGRAHV